jgi:hypothetical protein
VHSAGVTLNVKVRAVPKAVRDRAVGRALEILNRDMAAYLAAMGIDRGLFELIKTVRFENSHTLTRDELFRFGIDRRELVETDWTFNGFGSKSNWRPVAYRTRRTSAPGDGGFHAAAGRTSFCPTPGTSATSHSQRPN